MTRVLITGGAGFIGYFLAQRLAGESGHEVVIADDLSRGRQDDELDALVQRGNVTLVNTDLAAPDATAEIEGAFDFIFHLAAVIGVRNVNENPDKVLRVNTLSTLNVFDLARRQPALQRLFFASTSEVYAATLARLSLAVPTPEDAVLSVDHTYPNRATYAVSKIFGECAAMVYGRTFGVPVTIGRFHNVYGPRMGFQHVIPEMFVKMASNTTIAVPSASHTRAFCYVDDAVDAVLALCESPDAVGEIVHIGNADEEIAIRDLVEVIAKVMDREIAIDEQPATPGSPARRCPDTTKLGRLIAFRPAVPLREGVGRTYHWYRERLDARYE